VNSLCYFLAVSAIQRLLLFSHGQGIALPLKCLCEEAQLTEIRRKDASRRRNADFPGLKFMEDFFIIESFRWFF
jgi:hypothetical protein